MIRDVRQGFQSEGLQIWTLRATFLLAVFVAIHFALRAATIEHENEAYIGGAPLLLACIFGLNAGVYQYSYRRIFFGAFVVSSLSAGGWAYERVAMTSAIEFMRYDWVFINYGSDPELNLIFFAISSGTSMAVGGTMGAFIRYVAWKPIGRRERYENRRTMR